MVGHEKEMDSSINKDNLLHYIKKCLALKKIILFCISSLFYFFVVVSFLIFYFPYIFLQKFKIN